MRRNNPEAGQLLVFDFDETLFKTSKQFPGGMNVKQSYERAVGDVFGEDALAQYHDEDGLRNRAPSEVVEQMLYQCSHSDAKGRRSIALGLMAENQSLLGGLVPESKGFSFDFNSSVISEKVITELFVRQKQSYMIPQIGTPLETGEIWPPPTTGFPEFWDTLQSMKDSGANITTGIISSGHEMFIQKTFDSHALPQPDIIVSEDDVRGVEGLDTTQLVKPSPFSLALAIRRWQDIPGLPGLDSDPHLLKKFSKQVIYFGDDQVKDGLMAENANVVFGHFTPDQAPYKTKRSFGFNDWKYVQSALLVPLNEMNQAALR